jgi:alkylation response protein AidB-like acyl-CoA dehydrogenase
LLDEVLPGVYRGEVRLALGYTEPEGGSDIATAKTKAVRDGDEWVINGQKMFTTGAHQRQYVFLLTNTDPNGRRHRNLTMFVVPLDAPGIEIQGCAPSTVHAPTSPTTATCESPTGTGSATSMTGGPC